jgi:hypothetical protein
MTATMIRPARQAAAPAVTRAAPKPAPLRTAPPSHAETPLTECGLSTSRPLSTSGTSPSPGMVRLLTSGHRPRHRQDRNHRLVRKRLHSVIVAA